MRFSQFFLPTLRENPAEAESVSHMLMLRAGMIRRLTSGVYTYLPLGLRVIRKVEEIVREEMNRAGAIELLMPSVQPAELWKESGRWDYYGPELLRFKDRNGRESCLAPTHEEVITDLIRREVRSYRQLPLNLYQIQTKFRDEIRPRFGLMRAREFIMKDAYSFDVDEAQAEVSYNKMYEAYNRIFERCQLNFRAVEADTGAIGGSFSHEFMVLAETGEDTIVACTNCSFGANIEMAEVRLKDHRGFEPESPSWPIPEEVYTPNMKTVEEVTSFLRIPPKRLIKTLIYETDKGPVVALVRGDHQVNEAKIKRFLRLNQISLADEGTVQSLAGTEAGFLGPVGLKGVSLLGDLSLKCAEDMVAGANRSNYHLLHVYPQRDIKDVTWADIRDITEEDPCPRCGKAISFFKGIEVGHIFKLGTKYSEAMGAYYLDEKGRSRPIVMGCYGIGIGRTVSAAIEQNNDSLGIIWPMALSPFQVTVLPLQMHEPLVVEAAESIYNSLVKEGVQVLMDDRDERPGVKFNDADLIGIPIRINVGAKNLRNGRVEVKKRKEVDFMLIDTKDVVDFVRSSIANG